LKSESFQPITGSNEPFALFRQWLIEATETEVNDPNAMSLATLGEGGGISLRVVLMKGFDEKGFSFFTNTLSRKGKQLAKHPQGAICFHWKGLHRQVRAEGKIEPVSVAEADAYHATRPRASQIAAWSSKQSEELPSRAELEARYAEFEKKFEGQDVPRPPHWSGYRLMPNMIEFWQGVPHRLHDRLIFTREGSGWKWGRVYP
jgi:pyridoxamine 5'-phosphate oxidase